MSDPNPIYDAEAYRLFYDPWLDAEVTARQVDLLEQALADAPGKAILDVACGHGRHANGLAERGFTVAGRDVSKDFLAAARADAAERGVSVDYREEDMRALADEAAYDAVLCLFTAFGYYDDDTNEAILGRFARALRPGGVLCLDVQNRDCILSNYREATTVEGPDGQLMIDRHRFDPETGQTLLKRTYLLRERRVDAEITVRLYTLQELARVLRDVGLTVVRSFGSWKGEPVSPKRGRLLVVARKA